MAGPIVYYFSSIAEFVFAKECDTVKLVEVPVYRAVVQGSSGRDGGLPSPVATVNTSLPFIHHGHLSMTAGAQLWSPFKYFLHKFSFFAWVLHPLRKSSNVAL